MEMWESRVLCEISKALWKPFCGFHSADISIADVPFSSFAGDRVRIDRRGCPRNDDRVPGRDLAPPWITAIGAPIIAGPLWANRV